MVWEPAIFSNIITAITAVVAVVALWRTIGGDHRKLELGPIMQQLEHHETSLETHRVESRAFQDEVREEFRSLSVQMTGLQVAALDKFATKAELHNRAQDLVREIDSAGRITDLAQRISRSPLA